MKVRRLNCRHCGEVKREPLDFLADDPLYTKRFAYDAGRRYRSATIKDVASELKRDGFLRWLGKKKSARLRLADGPVDTVPLADAGICAARSDFVRRIPHYAPSGEALDQVRKSAYAPLQGRDKRYIKSQKYTLLSRREDVTLDGRRR
jgi:hypothetical protein